MDLHLTKHVGILYFNNHTAVDEEQPPPCFLQTYSSIQKNTRAYSSLLMAGTPKFGRKFETRHFFAKYVGQLNHYNPRTKDL